jgi:outer membrane protein OmpA-like peptidoglycan-associated protein
VMAVALGLDTARPSDRILVRATLGGGVLRVRGTVDPSRPGFDAEVKLGGARVAQLIPGNAAPDLRVTDGRLSGRFRLAGPPWAATRVALALDALHVVEASARDGEVVFACDRAVADADRIDTTPLRARLRRAALGGVTLRARRERDGLWPANRLAALGAWPAVQALLATPASGSGPIELPSLDVSWERGTFVFEDRVLDPAARLAVHDLEGALHREAGGSPRRMTGTVHGTLEGASFAADLGVEGSRWRISLDTKPLDASILNPWLAPALDLTVTGTVAAETQIDLRGRDFAALGRVSLESLVIADRGGAPRLLGLPLPRAITLAADDGRIALVVTASGALDDAGVALTRALADALAPPIIAPIAGVVTAPLVLPFQTGSDSLEDPAAEVVDRLAVFLHRQPALTVSLRGRSSPDDAAADPDALARARAEHVRERLCRGGAVPEERVRLGASATGDAPATVVEIASGDERPGTAAAVSGLGRRDAAPEQQRKHQPRGDP